MADEPNDEGIARDVPGEAAENEGLPGIAVESQYIKDLSFENLIGPDAPQAILQNPNISVEVNTNARPIAENRFEVSVFIHSEALTEDNKTLFIVELTYAGAFELANVPEDSVGPLLMIEGASLLFPFARSIVATVTRDGGFPPLLISPIDFAGLYSENNLKAAEDGNGSA